MSLLIGAYLNSSGGWFQEVPPLRKNHAQGWATLFSCLGSEVLDVDVGTESDVVGEIPAGVVGIFVDHDVVAIPEPAVAVADVVGSDAEVEAAEPETIGSASGEPPDVTAAKAAGKASVFPRMIEMVVRVVAAGVMADPLAIGVDMRRVGMTGVVVEVTVLLRGRGMRFVNWSRAVGGDVRGAAADFMVLGIGCERNQEADC